MGTHVGSVHSHVTGRLECGDFVFRKPKLGQYLAAMLTNQRRWPLDGRRGLAHFDCWSHHAHFATARVIVAGDHAHMRNLSVFSGATNVLHLGAPDVGRKQPRQQSLGSEFFRLSIDLLEYLVALAPLLVRNEIIDEWNFVDTIRFYI